MDTIGDKKRKIRSEDKEIVITITEVVTRTIGLLPGTCHSQMVLCCHIFFSMIYPYSLQMQQL